MRGLLLRSLRRLLLRRHRRLCRLHLRRLLLECRRRCCCVGCLSLSHVLRLEIGLLVAECARRGVRLGRLGVRIRRRFGLLLRGLGRLLLQRRRRLCRLQLRHLLLASRRCCCVGRLSLRRVLRLELGELLCVGLRRGGVVLGDLRAHRLLCSHRFGLLRRERLRRHAVLLLKRHLLCSLRGVRLLELGEL